jgi:cytochrome oxidase assembly protein ShyY1
LGTISVAALAQRTKLQFAHENSFYLRLAAPYAPQAPKILPKPELTEGNHLSYALQWILFALMGFALVVWAVRQEINFKRMQQEPDFRPSQKKRLGDSDKEYEDSLS